MAKHILLIEMNDSYSYKVQTAQSLEEITSGLNRWATEGKMFVRFDLYNLVGSNNSIQINIMNIRGIKELGIHNHQVLRNVKETK